MKTIMQSNDYYSSTSIYPINLRKGESLNQPQYPKSIPVVQFSISQQNPTSNAIKNSKNFKPNSTKSTASSSLSKSLNNYTQLLLNKIKCKCSTNTPATQRNPFKKTNISSSTLTRRTPKESQMNHRKKTKTSTDMKSISLIKPWNSSKTISQSEFTRTHFKNKSEITPVEKLYMKYSDNLYKYFDKNKNKNQFTGLVKYKDVPIEDFLCYKRLYSKFIEKSLMENISHIRHHSPGTRFKDKNETNLEISPLPNRSGYSNLENVVLNNDYKEAERYAVSLRKLEYTHSIQNCKFKIKNPKEIRILVLAELKNSVDIIERWWLRILEKRRKEEREKFIKSKPFSQSFNKKRQFKKMYDSCTPIKENSIKYEYDVFKKNKLNKSKNVEEYDVSKRSKLNKSKNIEEYVSNKKKFATINVNSNNLLHLHSMNEESENEEDEDEYENEVAESQSQNYKQTENEVKETEVKENQIRNKSESDDGNDIYYNETFHNNNYKESSDESEKSSKDINLIPSKKSKNIATPSKDNISEEDSLNSQNSVNHKKNEKSLPKLKSKNKSKNKNKSKINSKNKSNMKTNSKTLISQSNYLTIQGKTACTNNCNEYHSDHYVNSYSNTSSNRCLPSPQSQNEKIYFSTLQVSYAENFTIKNDKETSNNLIDTNENKKKVLPFLDNQITHEYLTCLSPEKNKLKNLSSITSCSMSFVSNYENAKQIKLLEEQITNLQLEAKENLLKEESYINHNKISALKFIYNFTISRHELSLKQILASKFDKWNYISKTLNSYDHYSSNLLMLVLTLLNSKINIIKKDAFLSIKCYVLHPNEIDQNDCEYFDCNEEPETYNFKFYSIDKNSTIYETDPTLVEFKSQGSFESSAINTDSSFDESSNEEDNSLNNNVEYSKIAFSSSTNINNLDPAKKDKVDIKDQCDQKQAVDNNIINESAHTSKEKIQKIKNASEFTLRQNTNSSEYSDEINNNVKQFQNSNCFKSSKAGTEDKNQNERQSLFIGSYYVNSESVESNNSEGGDNLVRLARTICKKNNADNLKNNLQERRKSLVGQSEKRLSNFRGSFGYNVYDGKERSKTNTKEKYEFVRINECDSDSEIMSGNDGR